MPAGCTFVLGTRTIKAFGKKDRRSGSPCRIVIVRQRIPDVVKIIHNMPENSIYG